MAVRGAVAKQEVIQKILKAFPGSFLYNDGKEIRINTQESGEPLQVKITLTCAKVAVPGGFMPPEVAKKTEVIQFPTPTLVQQQPQEEVPDEPSKEEKERLAALLENLGL